MSRSAGRRGIAWWKRCARTPGRSWARGRGAPQARCGGRAPGGVAAKRAAAGAGPAAAPRRLGRSARGGGTVDPRLGRCVRQESREAEETILPVARREGAPQQIAAVLLSLVRDCLWLGDLDATWTYGLEARQLMEQLGDLVGLAQVLEL